MTYKQRFNKKYKQPLNKSNSIADIAKLTGIKKSALQKIYNKGTGAWKNNLASVRLKSGKKDASAPRSAKMGKEQWSMARIYSAVMGGPASKVDAKELREGKKK